MTPKRSCGPKQCSGITGRRLCKGSNGVKPTVCTQSNGLRPVGRLVFTDGRFAPSEAPREPKHPSEYVTEDNPETSAVEIDMRVHD